MYESTDELKKVLGVRIDESDCKKLPESEVAYDVVDSSLCHVGVFAKNNEDWSKYILHPLLKKAEENLIVVDPDGELCRSLRDDFEKRGYKVHVFYRRSDYDPFLYIKNDTDISVFVDACLSVEGLQNRKDDGWSNKYYGELQRQMLSDIVYFCSHFIVEPEKCDIHKVNTLLYSIQDDFKTFKTLVSEAKDSMNHYLDRFQWVYLFPEEMICCVANELARIVRILIGDGNWSCVQYPDPAKDKPLRLECLTEEKTVLFYVVKDNDELGIRIFIDQYLHFLQNYSGKPVRRTTLILDDLCYTAPVSALCDNVALKKLKGNGLRVIWKCENAKSLGKLYSGNSIHPVLGNGAEKIVIFAPFPALRKSMALDFIQDFHRTKMDIRLKPFSFMKTGVCLLIDKSHRPNTLIREINYTKESVLDALYNKRVNDCMASDKTHDEKTDDHIIVSKNVSVDISSRGTNAIIIGSSYSNRTGVSLLPNLLHAPGSVVVVDVYGSLYDSCGDYISQSKKVHVLDLYEPEKSTFCYNPLAYINSVDDISALVDTIFMHTCGVKDRNTYFSKMERTLLCALLAYVHYNFPEHKQKFFSIIPSHDLIETNIDVLFNNLRTKHDPNEFAPYAVSQYDIFKQLSDQTRSAILASLIGRLRVYKAFHPQINSIDDGIIHRLQKEPSVVFLRCSPVDGDLWWAASCFFEQVVRTACSKGTVVNSTEKNHNNNGERQSVLLLMDEFPDIAAFSSLPKLGSLSTDNNISMMIYLQSIVQLHKQYDRADSLSIIDNAEIMALLTNGVLDAATKEQFESICGYKLNLGTTPTDCVTVLTRGKDPIYDEDYDIFKEMQRLGLEYLGGK